jgi:predicted porin
VGAQKGWVWKGSNSIYVGYTSMFGFADPQASQRDEHSVFAGAQVRVTPRLAAELYYRLSLFDYQGGRYDLNQTVVTSLAFHFTKWCELNASVSFAADRSNRSQFDYNAVTTGAGLTLTFMF